MTIETNKEALLVKSDAAAKALRNNAIEDAKILLRIAAKRADAGATDETAKAVLSKAVEDAKVLISEAAETAISLLTTAVKAAELLRARVTLLEGILPICMYCKKIRDDSASWHQLETYISSHSEAHFSHGICPECYLMMKARGTGSVNH